jgi:hypothetical protein
MSLAWAPDGSNFAVGSYNTVRLCDSAGVRFIVGLDARIGDVSVSRSGAIRWRSRRMAVCSLCHGRVTVLKWHADVAPAA